MPGNTISTTSGQKSSISLMDHLKPIELFFITPRFQVSFIQTIPVALMTSPLFYRNGAQSNLMAPIANRWIAGNILRNTSETFKF